MKTSQWRDFSGGFASGAGVALLFGGSRGRQRRQRAAGLLRHTRRRALRSGRATALQLSGRTHGILHRLQPLPAGEPLDEAGLAHKVESILFRDPQVPKGRISINAEGDAVFLRGEVDDDDLIRDLSESVRRIAGVGEVVNLLHRPGTPAPHREDTPSTG